MTNFEKWLRKVDPVLYDELRIDGINSAVLTKVNLLRRGYKAGYEAGKKDKVYES